MINEDVSLVNAKCVHKGDTNLDFLQNPCNVEFIVMQYSRFFIMLHFHIIFACLLKNFHFLFCKLLRSWATALKQICSTSPLLCKCFALSNAYDVSLLKYSKDGNLSFWSHYRIPAFEWQMRWSSGFFFHDNRHCVTTTLLAFHYGCPSFAYRNHDSDINEYYLQSHVLFKCLLYILSWGGVLSP